MTKTVYVFDSVYGLLPFDPENCGADPAAFAEMWPHEIFFYMFDEEN